MLRTNVAAVLVALCAVTMPAVAQEIRATEASVETQNRALIAEAFSAWAAGRGDVFSLLADDAIWHVTGFDPSVARTYRSRQALLDATAKPLGARLAGPIRPVVKGALEQAAMSVLQHHLFTQEHAKIYTEAFNREVKKISGNEIDRELITRNRLAVIETELENLSANMLSGLLSPTLMKMLSDREAEKAELETRLSRTAPAKPIAQIVPHPELLQKFKEKIGALRDKLNDERIRTEAAELMDRLIESVTIYLEGAHGPEAEIVAKVADLAVYALNDNTAPGKSWGGVCSSMAVVAGVGFEVIAHDIEK